MDIKRLKQLSGLAPIVEAWDGDDFDRFMNGDDEDDLSPSERELAAQADRDLSAKGIEVDDFDDEDDFSALGAGEPEDDDFEDELELPPPRGGRAGAGAPPPDMAAAAGPAGIEPELGTEPEMGDMGAEAPPPEAEEAQAMTKEKKAATARSFLTNNPNATRKEFMIYAAGVGMSGAYANTFYYAHKKKVSPGAPPAAPDAPMEFWVVKNAKGKVLTESGSYDLPMWADYTDTKFDARIFEQEIHAKKAVAALAKYGFKEVIIQKEAV